MTEAPTTADAVVDRLRGRLEELSRAHELAARELADPAVLADHSRYARTAKRHAELSQIVDTHAAYRAAREDAQAAR
ncbi:MAG: hypothetical protein M3N17_04460, partial [Actinomycetota bacterium]|nr:hypothetical protein [Actinomycetota bacterium]